MGRGEEGREGGRKASPQLLRLKSGDRCSLWLRQGCLLSLVVVVGGYFGAPRHWRVCSQGFHEGSQLEAAISWPAPASFSQGHLSAGPLPRGSLPERPPAGFLRRPAPPVFGGTTRISMHFPRASGRCLSHSIRQPETSRSKFPQSPGDTSLVWRY